MPWPSRDFLKAGHVIIGHEHPRIEITDPLGQRFSEPVWLFGRIKTKIIMEKFKLKKAPELPDLIIMPSFNPLSGGMAMNRPNSYIEKVHRKEGTGISPLVKNSLMREAEAYLIDGTTWESLGIS